jgi:hypothetical protein
MNVIVLVLSFNRDNSTYNKELYQFMQSKLDERDSLLIVEQVRIDSRIDSLNKREEELFELMRKYDNNLTNSVEKIKIYRDEIVKHNYIDSTTNAIVDRINAG